MQLPRVLGSDDLPLPELMAAGLDGELFGLGAGHCPVDAVETPALRLASVIPGGSVRYVAELGTAAWVWGARPTPPLPVELCVEARARAARIGGRLAIVREVVLAPGEVQVLDGLRVTTPLRTAIDLARARERFGSAEASTIRRLSELGGFGFTDCLTAMSARRNLPDKRRAAERLKAALEAR